MRRKILLSVVALAVLAYLSFGIMGAARINEGTYYPWVEPYTVYSPMAVAHAIFERIYNAFGLFSHTYNAHNQSYIVENVPGYYGVSERLGVVGITLVCAVLLSISGMLYQNVFKNPIAGPGMLGVSSGVSLGMMLMVAVYGAQAPAMLKERYLLCYGFGAAILVFVILVGKKLSGRGKPFDIVTMLLIGSILSQLIGFVVSYETLFVMDPDVYEIYVTLSQMLIVDTSWVSWLVLGIAGLASFIPVWLLRFRMNALAFDAAEVKLFGINYTGLRAIALICGAIMILAAQVHVGMVGMVSLIVPFMSRSWFGCEFSKQFTGNICISTIFLLACRDIADLIPFVGSGIAIGSSVSVAALPLFMVIMAKQMRGWG
ncbi:MAG: iron ABC transporter permease [Clostridiales Family XIII bacterium]|nr:iron ABC transporter permease [Clostridiales Family XIII bacterium]